MKKLFSTIILGLLLISCNSLIPTFKKHPDDFIGTWTSVSNPDNINWYVQNLPNGKSVARGIASEEIIGYEAEWWVKGDTYFEKITKLLYTDEFEDRRGVVKKYKIKSIEKNKHVLKECPDCEVLTYNRLANIPSKVKYQMIDRELTIFQSTLPDGDGNENFSAFRDGETVVYKSKMNLQEKSEFNAASVKKKLIKTIKQNPTVQVSQMKIKVIYLFPDGDKSIINIDTEDYTN